MTDSPGVPVKISGRETLICAIKESEMFLRQKGICNLLPLILCWVDTFWAGQVSPKDGLTDALLLTCGIVRASVEEKDGFVRS